MSTQEKKTKGMCIATRCTSVEQFIQMFHRFVDVDSFFVSTLNTRPPGLETSFSVQLADGTPVLKGLCVVQQAWTDANNPFKTPGVRLGIKRLTANSMLVFEQLLVTRTAAKPPTTIAVGAGTPTVAAAPKPVTPTVTKPLGAPPKPAVSVPKVITPLSGAAPRPIAKSPFTETAPTRLAPSRVELHQPARASSEAAIPEAVTAPEITDVIEEKTDVREPKLRLVPLPPGATDEAKADAKPEAAPEAKRETPKVEAQSTPRADTEAPTIERTPGSDLVLPANPLMNLTDESLEGYVDCTLYEETGNFFPVDEDPSVIVDDVVPPPVLAPRPVVARAPTPPPMGPNDKPPAKEFDEKSDSTEIAAPRFQSTPGSPAYAAGVTPPALPTVPQAGPRDSEPALLASPPRDSVMVDPSLIARGSTPVFDGAATAERKPEPIANRLPLSAEATPLPEPVPATDDYVVTPPRAVPIAANPAVATPVRRRGVPWWLYASLGVLAVAGVAVFMMARRSDDGGTAPPPPPKNPAPQVAEVTPPGPDKQAEQPANPEQPAGDPGDEPDEPAPGGGPPVVGGGPCKVVVATTPAGSIVSLDDKPVGPSPLTVAASCDKHKLDIAHPRYQAVTKLVSLAEGKPENVDVTLMRPTHTVTVNSTPAGATIFIDGRSAGTTPTKMSVLGFTTLKLEFKKTGYQPATTKLYSKVPQDTVSVRLNKW